MPDPLRVEVVTRGPAGYQRQHNLGEEHRLQLRLRLLRLGQPGVQVGHALARDGVPLAVRPGAGLNADDLNPSVALQLGQGAVDLAEADRLGRTESPVVGLLQVVAVPAGPLE
jgi:hypothetical protein